MPRGKAILLILILAFCLTIPSYSFAQIVINEFCPNPESGSDWIELYSEQNIDISGWILKDEKSVIKTLGNVVIDSDTSRYYLVEVSNRLNKTSDTVVLQNTSSEVIDTKSYDFYLGEGKTFGRFPDGGEWGICTATKVEANAGCAFPTPTPIPDPTSTPSPTTIKKSPRSSPAPVLDDSQELTVPTSGGESEIVALLPTDKPGQGKQYGINILGEKNSSSPELNVSPTASASIVDHRTSGLLLIAAGISFSAAAGCFFLSKKSGVR